jgi:alpha-beta hydrolase superfamily lysophospholipase
MTGLRRNLKRVGRTLAVALLGFLVGVLLLYVWWARSGPPVQPWHTVELEEELTAAKAEAVRTLADYQVLEERVLQELDAKVFAVTPTGPEYTLVRYSAGSASDPRQRQPNWNRTFELGPEEAVGGVLLLHGMSDGPYSLRALGEALAGRGYRVLGLRMPGHGTAPSGLRTVTWEAMAAATRLGVRHLAGALGDKPIHVMGYSTGAALALDYALNAIAGADAPVPASLVLVSPAIGITRLAALTPWVERLSRLPGLEQLAWTANMPEFDPFNYNSFSVNASVQVHRMTRSVASRVRALASRGPIASFPPTLLLLTTVDATVSPDAVADQLLKHLAPEGHELILYDINRFAIKSPLLIADPGPLTERLMGDGTLPFALTLIANESPQSRYVTARSKPPLSPEATRIEPLNLAWPDDTMSLSHVDLPFPPDDPLYGRYPPEARSQVFLGQLAIRGERGVLKIPAQWLLRLRHNPFYDYQERRVLEWIERASGRGDPSPAAGPG